MSGLTFPGSTANAFHMNFFSEYKFWQHLTPFLRLKFGYTAPFSQAYYYKHEDYYPVLTNKNGETVSMGETASALNIETSLLTSILHLGYEFLNIRVFAGPEFSIINSRDVQARYLVHSPQGGYFQRNTDLENQGIIRYSDDSRTVFFPKAQTNSSYWSMNFGIGYNFQFDDLSVTPEVSYSRGLNNLSERAEDWKLNSLSIGLKISYGLY